MHWKIKFFITLLAILVTCVLAPIMLWFDYRRGDWFLLSVDAAIVFMWGDYLWHTFKKQT